MRYILVLLNSLYVCCFKGQSHNNIAQQRVRRTNINCLWKWSISCSLIGFPEIFPRVITYKEPPLQNVLFHSILQPTKDFQPLCSTHGTLQKQRHGISLIYSLLCEVSDALSSSTWGGMLLYQVLSDISLFGLEKKNTFLQSFGVNSSDLLTAISQSVTLH